MVGGDSREPSPKCHALSAFIFSPARRTKRGFGNFFLEVICVVFWGAWDSLSC